MSVATKVDLVIAEIDAAQLRDRVHFLERVIKWLDSDIEDYASVRYLASCMGAPVLTADTYMPVRADLRHLVQTLIMFPEWVSRMDEMIEHGWSAPVVALILRLYEAETSRTCNECDAPRAATQGPWTRSCPKAQDEGCKGTLVPEVDYSKAEYMAVFRGYP